MKKATVDLFTRIFAVLAPPPDMTISQWADEYRRLSSEAAAEPGGGERRAPLISVK